MGLLAPLEEAVDRTLASHPEIERREAEASATPCSSVRSAYLVVYCGVSRL